MQSDIFKNILDNLHEGVYLVDLERRITYWNHGAQRIAGYTEDEVIGRRCTDNLLKHISADGQELCMSECPLSRTMQDGQERVAQVFLHHKDGHRVPVQVRISALRDAEGRIAGAVEVFSDATSRLRIQDELSQLKHQVLMDPLTGLANRRGITREFERRMGELRRYNIPFGLLFIDIDHFKTVNDSYGHKAGDQVLVAVAKTLRSALRDMDSVSRWGGEEFVALLPRLDEPAFRAVAERMRRFVELSPIPLADGPRMVTVSIGGALARSTDTLESLAARADVQMYQAKQLGRNRVQFEQACQGPPA